jgi:hypothetical protein
MPDETESNKRAGTRSGSAASAARTLAHVFLTSDLRTENLPTNDNVKSNAYDKESAMLRTDTTHDSDHALGRCLVYLIDVLATRAEARLEAHEQAAEEKDMSSANYSAADAISSDGPKSKEEHIACLIAQPKW